MIFYGYNIVLRIYGGMYARFIIDNFRLIESYFSLRLHVVSMCFYCIVFGDFLALLFVLCFVQL